MKFLYIIFFLFLTSCGYFKKSISTEKRIQDFQKIKLQTKEPVEVLWSKNLIPRIKAENSEDLFYTLGAVQMHLRRSQLEIYRKISRGALSEMAGPVSIKIDKILKSIDFIHAAKLSLDAMSEDSKQVLEFLVRGMNDYISQSQSVALDLRILGIQDEKWTVLDLVGVYKLTSTDMNWTVFSQLLQMKNSSLINKIWDLKINEKDFFEDFLLNNKDKFEPSSTFKSALNKNSILKSDEPNAGSIINLSENISNDLFDKIEPQDYEAISKISDQIDVLTEAGSNAFVVNGKKTKSKSALISSDPHLGILIPNTWLFVILDSPEYKTMGYIIPSFPVPVIGRNQDIGWGGTNLWGISTYPVFLNYEAAVDIKEETKTIGIRMWPDKKIKVYKYGPYPVLRAKDFPEIGKKDVVFRWQGYEPSNEMDTFLKVNKAKNFSEFHQAFSSYGVAGMTFVYGDKKGNIGKVVALTQPQVKKMKLFYDLEDFESHSLNSLSLPKEYNPDSGVVVSANDYTSGLKQPMSLFQAPSDRKNRMIALLKDQMDMTSDQVKQIQKDVFSKSAYDLKIELVRFVKINKWLKDSYKKNFKLIEKWDGNYSVESRGALATEVFMAAWIEDLVHNVILEPKISRKLKQNIQNFLLKNFNYRQFLINSLTETHFLTKDKFYKYMDKVQMALNRNKDWGEFHQLDLRHPLGNLKLFRFLFSYYKGPWSGGNETLAKASHRVSTKSAKVSFGAQARWITDMSDMNENYMVYVGGQDSFVFSQNINDLTELWRNNLYLKVPFDREEFNSISAYTGQ